ncbi:hypothetical protein EB796_011685 [Bugula neritina]|uniref:SUEL-type lectin domain-containing protein n=1 Tax=Bugula neritina TaxID=10212 RepID=A0A7J7JXD2_BUGNE|nr:hypothetical protein EB796_011685 [Bugula neritina]
MAAWSFALLCVYFLIILQAATSNSAPQTQTCIFDEHSGELSRSANISCPQYSVIEIISLEYYSSSVYCTQLVCPVFGNSKYLDGQHSVCQNEDRIRVNCYAIQNCSIGHQGINITVPKEECETGYPKAKLLRVKFSCIKSDSTLDICEDRYETIPSSQSVFLTPPSPDTAAGETSCSCEFKPANQQLFTQNITLMRQRMAHFFKDEYFLYRAAGQGGWLDSPSDDPYYLSMNRTLKFGVNLNKFTVVLADNTQLTAQSSVYVKLTSSDPMEVFCNDASNNPGMYTKGYTVSPTRRASSTPPTISTNTVPATQATSRKVSFMNSQYSDILIFLFAVTPDVVTSSTTDKGGGDGGLTQRDMIITGLTVALCVIIIVVVLLTCLFCFRR